MAYTLVEALFRGGFGHRIGFKLKSCDSRSLVRVVSPVPSIRPLYRCSVVRVCYCSFMLTWQKQGYLLHPLWELKQHSLFFYFFGPLWQLRMENIGAPLM